MDKFSERLIELMDENDIDAKTIVSRLELANSSVVYKWRNGHKSILLNNAIELANLFKCSLDYLFGRSIEYGSGNYKKSPPFGKQLKKVLKEQNSSQNKIIKFAKISSLSLNNWLNNKGTPHIESVIKIADYLNISLDELVGREQ